MASDESTANDTILNMISNLKPKIKIERSSFEFESSLKRSLGENSFEGATPKKRAKIDDSYLASPRETRRLRADVLEARNVIKSLENRVNHLHNVRKEMQIMFDDETKGLKKQRERDEKTIQDLEEQLQTIRKREVDLKNELSEVKNKYKVLQLQSDERIEEVEKDLVEMRSETSMQEDVMRDELMNMKQKIDELELVLEAAQEDAEAHKKLCSELEKQLNEKQNVEKELEMKDQALLKLRLELKDLEYVKENYLEYQQQSKTQHQKLSTYAALERENQTLKEEAKRLRDEVYNKLVLEEEVNDLKGRLVHYKEQEKKLSTLQVEKQQADMHLNEWRTVARNICEATNPETILPHMLRFVVEKLQQQEINLTSDKVQLESQLNNVTHEAKVAKAELEKTQKLVVELQRSVQQRQNLIHRIQKKLLLVSRERDSYRLQLDSYERDLTINQTMSNQTSGQQMQKERIENLEHIVEKYREMVTKLETDLQNAEPGLHNDAVPVRTEQITRLQDEVDKLKADNQHLREQRDRLEIQMEQLIVGQDSNSGRIVHLAKNPSSEMITEYEEDKERLQLEVEKLKRKIRKMEEGLEASKLDSSVSIKDLQALREQLKSSENQVQRLKEYFRSSMKEFRNVIYLLFGYKVDKTSNSQYKLSSMYADSPTDQICFQVNTEGGLDLLESDFSATLEDMVDLHLRHQKSIPVFLSAITVDLFNNRTGTTTFEIE